MKIMAIGAHPDDCEIKCGGSALKLVRAGHTVRFVSATNGEKGHHKQEGQPLIDRRKQEAKRAAEAAGVEPWVMDIPDGEIQPDLATRWRFIRLIREFAPDYVITHRPWDYHPDHRITSQLVQDCSYLVRVPHVCPDVPIPDKAPVILLMSDFFSQPLKFKASLAVNVDDVYDEKITAIHCHASQVYEWLPWIDGRSPAPEDEAGRLEFLKGWMSPRDARAADDARECLVEIYGAEKGTAIKHAETYEISEYGRQVSAEELRADWNIS